MTKNLLFVLSRLSYATASYGEIVQLNHDDDNIKNIDITTVSIPYGEIVQLNLSS